MTRRPIIDRLMEKVIPEPNSGCWLWTGFCDRFGYGRLQSNRTGTDLAHRILYELTRGAVPKDLQIDHLCRVPCCVNPDHMEPVTQAENIRRGIWGMLAGTFQRAKTHCPHGHAYTPENIYAYRGKRNCRICRADSSSRFHKKEAA